LGWRRENPTCAATASDLPFVANNLKRVCTHATNTAERVGHQRKCFNGILYRACTGCQWNRLPEKFGEDTTLHRSCGRVEWQCADGCRAASAARRLNS